MVKKIKCAIIRGGTSKGIYILDKYLPADPKERENIILKIFGSRISDKLMVSVGQIH